MQTMKRKGTSMNEDQIKEGEGQQDRTNLVALGDMIWVELHGDSWWPAQVVDENTVTEKVKPDERSEGEVLVRLYGSYEYLYVNPIECRSEFERILKQNHGSCRLIFQKALEKDLPSSKSSRSKNSGSKPKANEKAKQVKPSSSTPNTAKEKAKQVIKPCGSKQKTGNTPNQIVVSNDNDQSSQSPELLLVGTSQESSGRRMRVMNKLGLTPPPGSPFHKK